MCNLKKKKCLLKFKSTDYLYFFQFLFFLNHSNTIVKRK